MNGLAIRPLCGLSLFSGIGGLDLGLHHIIKNSRTICFVEGEVYAAKILHQRMQEGKLHLAPIYSDVRTFSSVAHHFSQEVDYITAGFPCQPFSQAGNLKGTNDSRWLWSSILEIIGGVRPSFLFLENVSNLLNEWGAFDEISKSLAQIGFCLEWGLVRAADVGANHQRNRLFIFAYLPSQLHRIGNELSHPNNDSSNSYSDGLFNERSSSKECSERIPQKERFSWNKPFKYPISFPDPNGFGWCEDVKDLWRRQPYPIWEGFYSSNPNGERCPQSFLSKISNEERVFSRTDNETSNPDSFGHHRRDSSQRSQQENGSKVKGRSSSNFSPFWWSRHPPFSPVCGVDDGISYGLDRLRALGNAVVPLQASHAFYHLIKRGLNHGSSN